jgi:hypothetical protein
MKDVDHQRVPLSRCPHCGHILDAASVLEGPTPKPVEGDLSICLGCGEVSQFDRRSRLRPVTASILADLDPDEAADLLKTQKAVRAFLASER